MMEEVIQLNLTSKESIILQAIAAVGISMRDRKPTAEELEKLKSRIYYMKLFMNTWPESSGSLADKMVNLVEITREIVGIKDETKMEDKRTQEV